MIRRTWIIIILSIVSIIILFLIGLLIYLGVSSTKPSEENNTEEEYNTEEEDNTEEDNTEGEDYIKCIEKDIKKYIPSMDYPTKDLTIRKGQTWLNGDNNCTNDMFYYGLYPGNYSNCNIKCLYDKECMAWTWDGNTGMCVGTSKSKPELINRLGFVSAI